MRASQAIGAFRDRAAAWIAKNPQGSMPEFTDYMRDQLGPILERTNKDYGDTVKAERQKEVDKGQMVVDKTKAAVEARDAQKAAEQKKQDEIQWKKDEITSFNQSYKPTGKVSRENGRQILTDGNGSIATEQLITIKDVPEINNGGITNIPTIFHGKKYSDEQAIDIMRRTGGIDPETGQRPRRYFSITDAQIAARERTKRIEKEYDASLASTRASERSTDELKKAQPK